MDNAIMLSYPRCGKSFLSHCLESMNYKLDSFENPVEGSVLTRTHQYTRIHEDDDRPLILLLRNYKECIPRHAKNLPDGDCDQGNYWSNVMLFHNRPTKKLLVFYEDLMASPFSELLNVVNFLNIPIANFIAFFEDFDTHKQDSLDKYSGPGTLDCPQTNGEEFFHSLKLSAEVKTNADKSLMTRDAKVYNWYLKRYQEKTS